MRISPGACGADGSAGAALVVAAAADTEATDAGAAVGEGAEVPEGALAAADAVVSDGAGSPPAVAGELPSPRAATATTPARTAAAAIGWRRLLRKDGEDIPTPVRTASDYVTVPAARAGNLNGPGAPGRMRGDGTAPRTAEAVGLRFRNLRGSGPGIARRRRHWRRVRHRRRVAPEGGAVAFVTVAAPVASTHTPAQPSVTRGHGQLSVPYPVPCPPRHACTR